MWVIVGICILLAPIGLTLWNDHRLDATARAYGTAVAQIRPDNRVRQLWAEADAYNTRLAASGHHAMVPDPAAPGMADYLGTLRAPETGDVIARLVIPAIALDLPVYHTTRSEVLYRGVGHMFGTDLPIGGSGRTSVLSAHTGMVNASMFDNLPRLPDGADVYVSVLGTQHRYRVVRREVVGPTDVSAITYADGLDKLVLVTCTPYGINSDRLLVEAVRVPDGSAIDPPPWRPRLSWWMILDLLVVTGVALVLGWRDRRRRRERRRAAEPR